MQDFQDTCIGLRPRHHLRLTARTTQAIPRESCLGQGFLGISGPESSPHPRRRRARHSGSRSPRASRRGQELVTYFSSTLHFPAHYARTRPARPRMLGTRKWPRVRSRGKVSDAHARCGEGALPPPTAEDVWHQCAQKASLRLAFLPTSVFGLDSSNSPLSLHDLPSLLNKELSATTGAFPGWSRWAGIGAAPWLRPPALNGLSLSRVAGGTV